MFTPGVLFARSLNARRQGAGLDAPMTDELLHHRGNTLVRRQHLAPGEAAPWHRDPFHRVAAVLSGDAIAIEYRDRGRRQHVTVTPGQVDWDEPTESVHRAVNIGGAE